MYSEHFSMVEPYGYINPQTKLERCWNSFYGCFGLRTKRITQFDPYAAMSRSPVQYLLTPFEVTQTLPDDEWINDSLSSFIRDEIMITESDTPTHFSPVIKGEIQVPDEVLLEFVQNSEWENLVQIELPKNNSAQEMANSIYKLLCNSQIGSSKNKNNNNLEEFSEHILPLLEERKRLLFVLPGFPFKDQNRFRVPYGADCVDFSEIAFLVRLHNLAQTLYQVHPFGAETIVLSDGRLYKDIFYIQDKQVEEYQWRLIYYRNKLNLQGGISVIDLKEMIDKANAKGVITNILSYLDEVIRAKYSETQMFSRLIQGIKWNMNTKELLRDLEDSDAWQIIKLQRHQVDTRLLSRWDEFHEKATNSAIEYAKVNLMLKWTDLIKKFFPESIRCTVHPKKDQFALTTNYAWNGVAWSEKWPKSIKDIQTTPYYSLCKQPEVYLVKMHSTNYPCFFTKERNNRLLECAKKVLKCDGWSVDNIFGREFSIYDCMSLTELGKDDPNFAWERRLMSKEYYTTLLQFRISHYKKYGFGVHAIFKDGVLIGQMGLQVLDEQQNQLEYVIFLGKEYTSQGIGTKLLTYLFQRCREEGIDVVYGVIRNDNLSAKALVTKFGGKALRTMAHYRQTGILYEIKLR